MIPFQSLQPLHHVLGEELGAAVQRVLDRGWFVLGPEVEAFEAMFARFHGVQHAVGVANGTDAIELALRASGIGAGDEVITVSHTAVATICAIERAGARPILVDIDPETFTIDPEAAAAAVGPNTRALLVVHLYGHPAEMAPLVDLARRHRLLLVEDCAQAHGARADGKLVGTLGDIAAFSFYPTKNLGACGDGGAVLTNNGHLAERLRRLRSYGQTSRYEHLERGINSRLDEIQAAILQVKLTRLEECNRQRRQISAWYTEMLPDRLVVPVERPWAQHVFHLYVVRCPERDLLRARLEERGIGTLVHYPVPVHLQKAYADLGYARGSLPQTEKAAAEVLSLPLYVGLSRSEAARVGQVMTDCLEEFLC